MCERNTWTVAGLANSTLQPIGASPFVFDFAVFYPYFTVQITTDRAMSVVDLLHEIGLYAAIFFVLAHLIWYVVHGIACCWRCKKENARCHNNEENGAPGPPIMTSL